MNRALSESSAMGSCIKLFMASGCCNLLTLHNQEGSSQGNESKGARGGQKDGGLESQEEQAQG